jgi:hypothetical protein
VAADCKTKQDSQAREVQQVMSPIAITIAWWWKEMEIEASNGAGPAGCASIIVRISSVSNKLVAGRKTKKNTTSSHRRSIHHPNTVSFARFNVTIRKGGAVVPWCSQQASQSMMTVMMMRGVNGH